jgi:hypothetical protein
MLKNNYLYHQGIHTIEDLIRKAEFYFHQHNHVIPLALHKGGRPAEIFSSSWGDVERAALLENSVSARNSRKVKNLQPPCAACPTFSVVTAAQKFGSSGS